MVWAAYTELGKCLKGANVKGERAILFKMDVIHIAVLMKSYYELDWVGILKLWSSFCEKNE